LRQRTGAKHGIDLRDVGVVEQVEGLGDHIEARRLAKGEIYTSASGNPCSPALACAANYGQT
jgi:hypothetical protein